MHHAHATIQCIAWDAGDWKSCYRHSPVLSNPAPVAVLREFWGARGLSATVPACPPPESVRRIWFRGLDCFCSCIVCIVITSCPSLCEEAIVQHMTCGTSVPQAVAQLVSQARSSHALNKKCDAPKHRIPGNSSLGAPPMSCNGTRVQSYFGVRSVNTGSVLLGLGTQQI